MNIGRYEVVEQLGKGGMANVYLAYDPYIKRQVAVKVLPPKFTHDPQFRVRFQREAEVIAAASTEPAIEAELAGEVIAAPAAATAPVATAPVAMLSIPC